MAVCPCVLQEGSYDGHERESLEDADMNILGPIFWVRRKLDQSTRPDHICHRFVQWSNYCIWPLKTHILAVLKAAFAVCDETIWWKRFLKFQRLSFLFSLLFYQKRHMLMSRTHCWAATKFGKGFKDLNWNYSEHYYYVNRRKTIISNSQYHKGYFEHGVYF